MGDATLRRELAQTALVLSRDMVEAVRQGRWDDLPGMQEQRAAMVTAVFSGAASDATDAGGWLEVMREVQQVNEALVALVLRQREDIAKELQGLHNARKVDSAYAMRFED